MTPALARCAHELADIEAQLLAGAGDVEGLLQGLQDWNYERRCILLEIEEQHGSIHRPGFRAEGRSPAPAARRQAA
jgi:hypothetical protein